MWGQSVVWHGSPWVVIRGWLWEPNVAGVTCELAGLKGSYYGVSVADFASGGVDDVGSSFHFGDELVVEEMFGAGIEKKCGIMDQGRGLFS